MHSLAFKRITKWPNRHARNALLIALIAANMVPQFENRVEATVERRMKHFDIRFEQGKTCFRMAQESPTLQPT